MKNIYLLVLVTLICYSCSKDDEINVANANFTATSDTLYLAEPCTFEAADTLGKQNYKWDFGDGKTVKGEHTVSHQYLESGLYTATLEIGGKYQTKTIRVLPGRLSYQIINNSNYYFNVLIYIDSYSTGATKRFNLNRSSTSGVIYATNNGRTLDSKTNWSQIFGISIFINNSEYTFNECPLINDFEHSVFTITDSTVLIPRTRNGSNSDKTYKLKDLFSY